jgi:mannose-1-phosphate guanylyltransferase
MMITPVLLCGGSGTRLWPLSRKSYPKQFSPLMGDETLFQASARRLSGAGFAPPLVVTGGRQAGGRDRRTAIRAARAPAAAAAAARTAPGASKQPGA